VYTQMITEKNIEDEMSFDQAYWVRARLVISLDALETGTYQYLTGPMGNRLPECDMWWWDETYFDHPNILEFTKQVQTKDSSEMGWEYFRNEVMIKERLDPSYIKGIILENEEDRRDLLKYLRTRDIIQKDALGNETILGHAIDAFFRIGDHVTAELFG
ncbi:MAG: hypothetical protein P0S94_02545, partial [Simkaniaceae bacterium]|nr:hypothetical protein [Simkaniaceae bacterium]